MIKRYLPAKVIFATCVAVVAIFTSVSAAAIEPQEPAEKVFLSLKQAQDYALEHNRTLKNASLDIQKAQASKWKAISSMLPQVSAGVDYSNYFGYKMDLGAMAISMPPYAQLGITSSIALTGAQIVGAQISEISVRMADISLKKSEQQIRDQVKVLYYSALVSEESIRLLDESLKSMNKLYEITKSTVAAGVSEQTAADQLKVQIITMETTVNSTKRALEMVYNSMRLQLNIDVDTEIELTQTIDELMNLEVAYNLFHEDFILDNNYDYQLLKESTLLAKKQVSLAGWNYGPTISVFHQYTTKKYFSDEMTMNMTPPNMLGVKLTIPIFSSGKNYAAVKEAKLSYKKQLNTLQDTEAALKVQYRQLIYNLRSAIEKYDAQKQNVEVAQSVFNNIAAKYEHGVASSLDITNSNTSLITAQSTYVQAILEIINAQISIEQLLNK